MFAISRFIFKMYFSNTCGYSCSYSTNSSIDTLVQSTPEYTAPMRLYHSTQQNYAITQKYETVEQFLKPNRPITQFINCLWQVQEYIIKAFKHLTGKDLPSNIVVKICDKEQMKQIHLNNNTKWNNGTMGFAIHGDVNQIFIRQNPLDQLMLTVGHEIGHVLSPRLSNRHNEEAKAFAFQTAWAKILRKHNIGGLSHCIIDRPAENGLHNVAFSFINNLIRKGEDAINIHKKLAENSLSLDYLL